MTNNSSQRLDRLEAILETTIQGLAETREAIAETRVAIAENNRALVETRQIVESNSRTLQGMLEQRATDRLEHEQRMRREEARIERQDAIIKKLSNVQEGLVRMLSGIDEERPVVLRKLNAIESKVDRLLERE